MTAPTLKATLTSLLSEIQDGKEIRTYLNRFGAAGETRFAIFKIGGAVIAEQADVLGANLSLLNSVGLTPIVIHGAGPQLDAALAARGLDRGRKDGLRITPPEAMGVVAETSMRTGAALAAAIGRHGGRAAPVSCAAITGEMIDPDTLGRVGEPVDVADDMIGDLVRSGTIPLLSNVACDAEGHLVNVNADAVARALAIAFKPLKIVFVTGPGGLLDEEGSIISSINLDAELDSLIEKGTIHSGMKLKLEEIGKLLTPLPDSTSVSITSADGLVRELFTHGGAGTLVRRGETITRHQDWDGINHARLGDLIEEAFGRQLKDGALQSGDLRSVYVSGDYRAAAVIKSVSGMPFLDKFVVARDARGEGATHALWRAMTRDYPTLFWRSRGTNRFNPFYYAHADGAVRAHPWTVFWAGDVGLDRAAPLIEEIAATPASFEDSS